jgi:hypothetical protein
MSKRRSGRTVKVSVSLHHEDLATFKRVAKASHGGNLSAALAAAAKTIRQREARMRLVEMLGGSTLTPAVSKRLDAELWGRSGTSATKRSRREKAA